MEMGFACGQDGCGFLWGLGQPVQVGIPVGFELSMGTALNFALWATHLAWEWIWEFSLFQWQPPWVLSRSCPWKSLASGAATCSL